MSFGLTPKAAVYWCFSSENPNFEFGTFLCVYLRGLLGARTLRTGLLALLLGARTLRTGLLALLLGARTLRTGLLALLLVTRSYERGSWPYY